MRPPADGLLFSGSGSTPSTADNYNQLKMTVGLQTTFGTQVTVDATDIEQLMALGQERYAALHT